MIGTDSKNTRGYPSEGPLIFRKMLIYITMNPVAMEIRRAIENESKFEYTVLVL